MQVFIGPRLKTVRTFGFNLCVHVTRDIRNRSMDHSEILGDVRGQKSKNHHMAAFLKKFLVFSKIAHLLQKRVSGGYWYFREKGLQQFV